MFAFVVLGLASSVLAKRLSRRNVSIMIYFVSSWTRNLKSNSKSGKCGNARESLVGEFAKSQGSLGKKCCWGKLLTSLLGLH